MVAFWKQQIKKYEKYKKKENEIKKLTNKVF